MKPISPKIQNYYTQTSVGNDISFAWKYGEGNHFQIAYKIDIFHNDRLIYSTDKVMSDAQNNISLYLDLEEQTQYSFVVSIWDENDFCTQSDKAYFVTGVKSWRGEWIGNETAKPFIARRIFNIQNTDNAVLSICASGQFEAKINGRNVSPYAYEGSQTDFNKHIHYSTYDVTDFIVDGENELIIETANGWYIGDDENGKRYFYTINSGYKAFGDCLAVIAQLKIDDEYITTDTLWEISNSKTTLADIYGSEDIDNTIEYKWFKAVNISDKAPKGQVIPFDYPPVIHKYCYTPKRVDKERMIFDFGQNMSSQFHLKIKGERGQKIKLIPAEKLSADGDIEQTVDTYSILTLSGNEDVFEQKFSVNGARWYKIEGAKINQIIEFKLYFTTSSAEDCGYFKCSNESYNKIYTLILKAIESNINHSHTDCPTIEKLGWLEPNHLMAPSVMYNKNVDNLWSKIAMDMRDAQYGENEYDVDNGSFPHEYKEGLIPSIAPRYAKFIKDWNNSGSFWDIIPWGSSIILAAWEQYRFYGNKTVIANNYAAAKKYLKYITEQYENYNRLYKIDGEEKFICAGLGDWGITQNGGESRENIETAFYYHDLIIMSKFAEILENNEDKNYYENTAETVKIEYNKALLKKNPKTDLYCYMAYDTDNIKITQANQAIPLCFGLVPKERINDVEKSFISVCDSGHFISGEIGLPYIFRTLSRLGRNDIINTMIMKNKHPSYLRFIECGETTLPEFWRDDARSRNHDMMGHIMEWFFTEVAGITSDDGFKNINVNKDLFEWLEWVECEYDSLYGKIYIKKEQGKDIVIKTPANTNVVLL